jgi:hypothetical protein
MKLAIMQPYFFPYIGYFSLMAYADEFILFDTVQYDRKGWMNRNRVLKPKEGWQYIRAGVVKPSFRAKIKDVEIWPENEWKDTLLRQLEHYKDRAPHYETTVALIEAGLSKPVTSLTELNKNTLSVVRDYLDITCPINIFSEMDLNLTGATHPGQWALRISEAVGTDEYVNPPGGKDIFDPEDFKNAGIKLTFLKNELTEYNQYRVNFENGLSIIDILMFCDVDAIKNMLCDFSIEGG